MPTIRLKYFLSFPQKNLSPEKTDTNEVFTFQFLNDQIDQNTHFVKLQIGNWYYCKFIIKKLKSKHLVCLSFL